MRAFMRGSEVIMRVRHLSYEKAFGIPNTHLAADPKTQAWMPHKAYNHAVFTLPNRACATPRLYNGITMKSRRGNLLKSIGETVDSSSANF